MGFFDMLTGQDPAEAAQGQAGNPGLSPALDQMDPALQAAMQPPKTQEELQGRMSGWQKIVDRINTDPNLQQAMMQMAAYLGAPMQWGESGVGRFAAAGATGLMAYGLGQQDQAAQAQAAQEAALKRQMAKEQIITSQDQRERAGRKEPFELGRLSAETQSALDTSTVRRLEAQVKEYELRVAQVTDPKERARMERDLAQAKIDLEKAKVRTEGAQAGAYGAAAAASSAHAGLYKAQAESPEKFYTQAKDATMTANVGEWGKLFEAQNPKPADAAAVPAWEAKRAAYVEKKLAQGKTNDVQVQELLIKEWDTMTTAEQRAQGPTFLEYKQKRMAEFNGGESASKTPVPGGAAASGNPTRSWNDLFGRK